MEKAEELEQLYEYGCKLFDAVKKEFRSQEGLREKNELAEHFERKLQNLENRLVQEGQKDEERRKLENKLVQTKEKLAQAENSKMRILGEMIQIIKRENGQIGK